MMIEDLTMLANLPIADEKVAALVQAEADKAAAAETLPPAKRPDDDDATETEAERVARRGQDPPEQEKAGEEDS
jgi:hypothetical protein